uniref:cDNA sequence BC024139 n=1 Tax=Jaculus jaculus TaxID=51337 RepID=A0A8C5KS58_JACJA
MGNPASRLGCLGDRRSRSGTGPRAQGGPPSPTASQGPLPPGIPWAWWGPHAVQVTEVTETVVTETVVTEAVEVPPCCQGRQPAQVPRAPLDTLCSWLDGMEELQASQGPLSTDAALATAQLREQELLLRLLRERTPQVEPRLQETGCPAELCAQWHRLIEQAEARWGLLEQLVPAVRSFEAAREAFLKQLSPGGRLLAELHLRPTGLEGALQHLQLVCDGAVAHAGDLERVLHTGRRLAELLTEDQAQLVQQQLDQLQELVRPTVSRTAYAHHKLPHDPRTRSLEPSPPTALEVQLDLQGSASEHPGFTNQKQLSVQLVQLAEQLEQLAQWTQTPSQAAAPTVPIWKWILSPVVLQAEMEPLVGYWSETEEQDVLKAIPGTAEQIWYGLTEQVTMEKEQQPEDGRKTALQELPWGQQALAMSWPRRGPDLTEGATYEFTCHLARLMELLGCQAIMSSPSRERMHTLEGMLLLVTHFVENLLTCSHRLYQTEPLETKVLQTRDWVLEKLPGLKHKTGGLGEALALRCPDQGGSGHLWNRAQACLLKMSSGDLSWRPWWTETTINSWSHGKSEPRERSQEDKNQWVPLQQGHLEQDLMDSLLTSGEQDRCGQGCMWRKHGPSPELCTILGPGVPNSQQQPHSRIRSRDIEGTSTTVARGRLKVQGASIARGALMVRVGGGWAALDEFLVKNDPNRAKGRTSQKIHERFLCWDPSRPASEVIALRLWTSIRIASRPLSQKTGLPTGQTHRDPRSYKVKASEHPSEENP